MLKRVFTSFVLVSLSTCSLGFAEDTTPDDLAGFGEDVEDDSLHVEPIQEEKNDLFVLTGDISFKTSAGYKSHRVKAYKTDTKGINYSGINQAQMALYLQLDSKLSDDWKLRISGDGYYDAIYDINSYRDYNHDTKDEYRTQLRFDDVYVQGKLSSDLDLKVGRQIVVWGKSDSLRVTDVINPLDNRLPGMTDIEDLRLSTGMAKLDYYVGDWDFSFMLIAEARVFQEAPPRSEFFPVDSVFLNAPEPFIDLQEPSTSWDNMQYAFAANGVFSGWDLSFYAADVFDSKWYLDPQTRTRKIGRVKMLGSAVNVAIGSWLLKSEVAFLDGVRYNSTQDEKNRLDSLVGVDYMGITDTVLSFEFANRHIFDYESQMSSLNTLTPDYVDKDEKQTAIRATRSFSNDTINFNALAIMFGSHWQYGGFARVWVDYEIADALNASVGVVDYMSSDKPSIDSVSDNDRVFLDITYSF
jgi:hypothetical protein